MSKHTITLSFELTEAQEKFIDDVFNEVSGRCELRDDVIMHIIHSEYYYKVLEKDDVTDFSDYLKPVIEMIFDLEGYFDGI